MTPLPGPRTTMTTGTLRVLRGRSLWLARALWALGVLGVLVITVYTGSAFVEYAHGGLAPVEARWDAANSAVLLTPTAPDAAAVIRAGDVLLARDGQPLPPRTAFPRSETVPLYGPYGAATVLTVQTPGEPPREVLLLLNVIADPNLRWLVGLGLPAEPLVALWAGGELLWVLMFVGAGLFVAFNRSDDPMALLTALVVIAFAPRGSVLESMRFLLPYQYPMQIFVSAFSLALVGGLVMFPTGRLTPPRWTPVMLGVYLLFVLNRYANLVPPLNAVYFPLDMGFIALAFVVQAYRFRSRYAPLQRQQVKWSLVGVAITLFCYFIITLLVPLLGAYTPAVYFVAALFVRAVASTVALSSFLFAMLRYRLYDADFFLNRSLVYGSVTAILVLLFALLALLVRQLLGTGESGTLALTLTALVIGLLFQPIRRRVQHVIDRRLFRLRLDLDQLAARRRQKHAPVGQGTLNDTRLGDYDLEGIIGRGGMGEVYRARLGNRPIAIKILPPQMSDHPERLARFRREMDIMSTLSHPNIVHLLDAGMVSDVYYLAMEYVQGRELSDYLRERRTLPLAQTRLIVRDLAAALDYVHAHGIIHRDVKPGNVMLQDVRAVLMDFGIARLASTTSAITQTGLIGTLEYAAPEQILDAGTVDRRADVYSLGVLTYHMLAGALPFAGGVGQMVFAHLQQPPPNVCQARPDLPSPVGQAIIRAMAKAPADRYASAGDFAAALGG